jgi:RNA polymerase sigma-70 factor (ECF subfamily)
MIEDKKHLNSLIEDCAKKNRKAQFELYNKYYKAMFNASCRIIGDIYTAEDVTQESFLSAFNKIKTYKGDVTFGAWLKKIVVNRSIDYLRKKKINLEFKENIVENETVEEPIYSEFETEELIIKIKQAILQLPEGFKIVTTLHLLEGYDYDEISEILKIKSSTVRSQFARAKVKLLELMKGNKDG